MSEVSRPSAIPHAPPAGLSELVDRVAGLVTDRPEDGAGESNGPPTLVAEQPRKRSRDRSPTVRGHLERLRKERDEAEIEVKELREELARVRSSLNKAHEDYDILKGQLKATAEQKDQLQANCNVLVAENAVIKDRLQTATQQTASVTQQVATPPQQGRPYQQGGRGHPYQQGGRGHSHQQGGRGHQQGGRAQTDQQVLNILHAIVPGAQGPPRQRPYRPPGAYQQAFYGPQQHQYPQEWYAPAPQPQLAVAPAQTDATIIDAANGQAI